MDKKPDVLFEASWEVCNKVGGIYTVVKSKAARIVDHYGKDYFLVGPYFAQKAVGEFAEEIPPDRFKSIFEELKREGIICHYGIWNVQGAPRAILIDFEGFKYKGNDIKKELWENFQIDSLRASYDYDEPVIWSYTVGRLIHAFSKANKDTKIAAQFHEWLSGTALLYLKKNNVKAGTIFTTHATVLGRTLASSNIDLYNVWNQIDPDKEAHDHFIEAKHHMEKQAALHADMFTTVSEITGMEAEHLLKKKPDMLLMNGLDIEKFPTFEEISIKHRLLRDRMRLFFMYYFFPYYTFDLTQSLTYFIAGRYEIHDKGIDMYIKSLGELNKRLQKENNKKTIIALVWVPANIRNIKAELIENKTYFHDIKDTFDDEKDELHREMLSTLLAGKEVHQKTLFPKELQSQLKGKLKRFKKKGNPPVCTHDLHDGDMILHLLKEAGLTNAKDDPVKVIYYPIYLSGADGLLDLGYYESMLSGHLGVFPSYYEPWGYTPMEAGALGVPSVTTDLAGFGRFFCSECQQDEKPGIYVLNRLNKSDEEATGQLTNIMYEYAHLSNHERIQNKLQARKIASTADWKEFSKLYLEAQNKAVEKAYQT